MTTDQLPSLSTSGPHSPEYTRDVGNLLAEAVRVLNYAARDGVGLDYPGDVYTLLGSLYTATERMPQLLTQLTEFLDGQVATGRLADDRGHDPAERTARATHALGAAVPLVRQIDRLLRDAQNALSGLHVQESTDG